MTSYTNTRDNSTLAGVGFKDGDDLTTANGSRWVYQNEQWHPVTFGGSPAIQSLAVTTNSAQGVEFTAGGVAIPLSSPPARINVGGRTADSAANSAAIAVPFNVSGSFAVNRVSGTVAVKQAGALMEIAIYDSAKNRVTTTEQREVPEVGVFEFAMRPVTLMPGNYIAVLYCNHATPTFGVESRYGAMSATGAMPLDTTLAGVSSAKVAPALSFFAADASEIVDFDGVTPMNIFVFGGSATKAWGIWALDNTKFAYTTDGGGTVTSAMTKPPASAGASTREILEISGKLYVIYNNHQVFVSSDTTSAATWVEITCPATAGLRHSVAKVFPYGAARFNDYLFVGEYTYAPAETGTDPTDPSGPRILKYGPLSGTPTWSKSGEFAGARHIHSFYSIDGVELLAVLGDAGWGSDIGIKQLLPAGINPTGVDTWTQWTSSASPKTNHYACNVVKTANAAVAGGIYGSSDRPGIQLIYSKALGTPGAFNADVQIFQPSGYVSTETQMSLTFDVSGTGNLIWFSQETTDPAIYMSPRPYTQSYRVAPFNGPFLGRAIVQNGYILIHGLRFKVPKLPWQ